MPDTWIKRAANGSNDIARDMAMVRAARRRSARVQSG
jgi:hypothetical protein